MERIGKYEIVDKIGVGGFGVVFKGYDPFIKRFVAVKTCTSDDEDIRNRFHQEAEIAGNLQHRNVVTVYDFGIQDGVPYLVQEYLTGEDLDRKIKNRAPVSYPEKLLYLVQIARGLEYAHSRGIIHRDIKPANIRILEDGTAKIMDFGIAKLLQQQSGLTQTGMTLGTAAYLAPEQIRGEPVNQRTDIFSYGILAYELITYQRPYSGEVISTVLYQILNVTPRPVREHWPECPPELVAVVEHCLEKDPSRRYGSCGELLRDLDSVLRKQRGQRGPGDASAALASSPTLTRPVEAPTAPVRQVAAPVGSLDLDYRLDTHRHTPRSISTSAAYRHKEIPRLAWVAALAGLAILVGGGSWYWRSSRAVPQAASAPTTTPRTGAATPSAAAPPPASATPRVAPAVGGDPAPATATATQPPPAPKPPEKGTVQLNPGWSEAITVTVDGGAARRLDQRQTLELAPGDHVFSFELLSPEYSTIEERRLRVRAGHRLVVDNPIAPPGRLTVLAAIGSSQAIVRVDEESLGTTPKLNHHLRPGVHRVQLAPLRPEAEGSEGLLVQVEIKSQVEATLTFDLRKRTHKLNEKPLAGGV